ncbi:transglutaminase family protein, partial [Nitrospirota bacterium]
MPLDPNKLPHRAAEPTKVKPRTSADEYKELRASIKEDRPFVSAPVLLASNVDMGGDLSGVWSEKMEYLQLAMAEGGPIEADLSENIEVKFTEAITAKATELGNESIKIYEWVRNNVEFVPTYGSIQGADMCLQTMECNAFDTASLLIALLRTSGIPARYAYGTVEIPIEKFMNWVGGFTDANSAMMFAAAGGIPTSQDISGGKMTKVRIEHIWVESWVDMLPSFGAIF